ncbi:MAG: S1 RNA-binding domain-containing protein, partial [Bacteroidaceae bacterium]|nr:S1 RNA-binding domain-containing protein [Bacteroidaceae bacterium]
VIGPGGKIIQGMQEETGATITIEEDEQGGQIEIAASNKASIDAAVNMIKAIVAVPEIGETYTGKVKSIMPYGCFVEFLPNKDGLLHISEIDWKRLETVEEAGIHEGDEIEVKLLDIDDKTGKFKLSHRVLLPKPEGYQERPERPRRENRDGHREERREHSDRREFNDRPRREHNDRPHREHND